MRNDTKLSILWDEMGAVKAVTDEVAPLISKIPKDYSTEEMDTGTKWIDGRSIYRKVVTIEADAEATTPTTKEMDLTSLNIDMILFLDGVFIRAGENLLNMPINCQASANNNSEAYYNNFNHKLTHRAVYNYGTYGGAFITLYYVKPTATETKKATKKKTTKNKED